MLSLAYSQFGHEVLGVEFPKPDPPKTSKDMPCLTYVFGARVVLKRGDFFIQPFLIYLGGPPHDALARCPALAVVPLGPLSHPKVCAGLLKKLRWWK